MKPVHALKPDRFSVGGRRLQAAAPGDLLSAIFPPGLQIVAIQENATRRSVGDSDCPLRSWLSPCRCGVISLCLLLLVLGPFLHTHLGAYRVSGFHLPGLDTVGAQVVHSAGARSQRQHKAYLSCHTAVHAADAPQAEWPDSAELGVGQSVLRERMFGEALIGLNSRPADGYCGSSPLILRFAVLLPVLRCIPGPHFRSPHFPLLYCSKQPAQAPPQQ